MNRLAIILICFISMSGCSLFERDSRFGDYQEPISPEPYPKDTGASELIKVWKKSIPGGGDGGYALLQPAFYKDSIIVASLKGIVSSFHKNTGKRLWKKNLKKQVFSGVAVTGDIVVVSLDGGELISLNASNGEIIWRKQTGRNFSSIPALGTGSILARSADGNLASFSLNNGDEIWKQEIQKTALGIHGDATPLVVNNVVISGLSGGVLATFNLKSGEVFWAVPLKKLEGEDELELVSDSDTTPVLFRDWVIASAFGGKLTAVRLQTGQKLWDAEVSTRFPGILYSDYLLVTETFGSVVLVDAINGDVVWRQSAFRGRGVTPPMVMPNRAIIGDSSGRLHLLNIVTGELIQSKRIFKHPIRVMLSDQEKLYVMTSQGKLAAYRIKLVNFEPTQ